MCVSFKYVIFYFDIIVFYCFDLCPPFCVRYAVNTICHLKGEIQLCLYLLCRDTDSLI